jgi:hypothetical protein
MRLIKMNEVWIVTLYIYIYHAIMNDKHTLIYLS